MQYCACIPFFAQLAAESAGHDAGRSGALRGRLAIARRREIAGVRLKSRGERSISGT
jgi:hypothetical protein